MIRTTLIAVTLALTAPALAEAIPAAALRASAAPPPAPIATSAPAGATAPLPMPEDRTAAPLAGDATLLRSPFAAPPTMPASAGRLRHDVLGGSSIHRAADGLGTDAGRTARVQQAEVVPLPAPVALAAVGLVGLLALRRRLARG